MKSIRTYAFALLSPLALNASIIFSHLATILRAT